MSLFQRSRRILTAFVLILVLTVSTACSSGTTQADRTLSPSVSGSRMAYQQLQQGNTAAGQNFGAWVTQTGKGLIKDAFVRDENKLGVVITPQVQPSDVKTLTRSLVQGFEHNFPNRNLTVLMYAPDKKLILTARYNNQTRQIDYQAA